MSVSHSTNACKVPQINKITCTYYRKTSISREYLDRNVKNCYNLKVQHCLLLKTNVHQDNLMISCTP